MNGMSLSLSSIPASQTHAASFAGLTGFLRHVRVSSCSRYTSYRHARFGNGTLCIRPDAKVRNGTLTLSNFSAIQNTLPSEYAFG